MQTIQIPIEYRPLFDPSRRYFAIHGGRGSLKSHTVARRLLIAARQSKKRILCTRELQKSIKDSVHKLLADIINEYGLTDFDVKKESIINTVTGSEFIFTGLRNNVTEIKSMEGIDYCWVEEAQSLSEASIDILTPTIRKKGSQIIFTFNRLNELDPVYVKFVLNKSNRTCVINVNYDVAQKYGWLPDVLEEEMKADKANPTLFAHKWLGEPLSQSDNAIISRDDVLEAMNRTIEDDGAEEVGVDVARLGGDRTVFWKRKGLKTTGTEEYTKLRTPKVCDRLEQFVSFNKDILLKIDDTGVGGGVTDEMMKRGYNVLAINFGAVASDEDKYPNLISEAWFQMSEAVKEAELPMDSELLMELSTRGWYQDNKGKRRVESKKEYKKRGFRSPDKADAAIICYYTPNLITSDDISM